MKNTFKKLALAAAIIAAPIMASATTTVTTNGISGSSTCTAAYGNDAYQIDVLSGASFDAVFENGDAAGVFCFDLNNTSLVDAVVTLAVATVNQLDSLWGFLGGVQLDGPVATADIAQGDLFAQNFSFLIAAGDSVVFDWTYGQAYATGATNPFINFSVSASPVPVPAAGFLLIGALGGLGIARRRRRKMA